MEFKNTKDICLIRNKSVLMDWPAKVRATMFDFHSVITEGILQGISL